MASPTKEEVAITCVYKGNGGFRYTCRDDEGKVIYDSPRAFRSRFDARKEITKRWPKSKVTFEV